MACSIASMPEAPTVPPPRSRRSSPAQNTGPSARITVTRSSAGGLTANALRSASSISASSALRFSPRASTTSRTAPAADTLILSIPVVRSSARSLTPAAPCRLLDPQTTRAAISPRSPGARVANSIPNSDHFRKQRERRAMQEVATGYGLIEGPVWDPAKGLYFSDVRDGGIHLLDRAGEVSTVLPRRRGVGG